MSDLLDYPDKGRPRDPAITRAETIAAMRKANGNRHTAALRLGISLQALEHRLRRIRDLQKRLLAKESA